MYGFLEKIYLFAFYSKTNQTTIWIATLHCIVHFVLFSFCMLAKELLFVKLFSSNAGE